MKTLEQLKFDLASKEQELDKIQLDIFTLNPKIKDLINEIMIIKNEISKLEDNINDN